QRLFARLARGRIGHRRAAVATGHRHPPVLGTRAVHARAGDPAAVVALEPGAFGEQAEVVEARVHRPWHGQIGVAAHAGATAVAAVLGVDAGDELERGAAPGRRGAPAAGAALDVGRHRHGHRTVRVRVAEAVVVHHVVGDVVVDAGLEFLQRAEPDVRFLQAQAVVAAVEAAAIHAAGGIARLAVADAHAEFEQGVLVGRPAEREVGVPLLPRRTDAV